LSAKDESFWQLKESVKRSLSLDEKRRAVQELVSSYGGNAIRRLMRDKGDEGI
jgi:hypothetical protein